MKKIVSLIISMLCVSAYAQDTLRIMTYNVAVGLMADMQQLGQYIKDKQVDIIALQEVDLYTDRPETPQHKGKNQTVELGFYSDMLPVFGAINNYPTGGYYGLGILSKYPITSINTIPLPQVVNLKEPRSMLVATWEINGKKLSIINTHLSLDKRNRAVQMKYIKKYAKKLKGIKIVCGDLNSDTDEGLVYQIFSKWDDALPKFQYTFSSWSPQYKYDYMLYEKAHPIRIINSQVDHQTLSDHYPCYIDIIIE